MRSFFPREPQYLVYTQVHKYTQVYSVFGNHVCVVLTIKEMIKK